MKKQNTTSHREKGQSQGKGQRKRLELKARTE
jgi:hypothetical protein